MITGDGGFVHRIMPPTDWDCGPIPDECYSRALTKREIESKLLPIYLEEDRIKKLANSDDEMEIFKARMSLEILAQIDSETIWHINNFKEDNG